MKRFYFLVIGVIAVVLSACKSGEDYLRFTAVETDVIVMLKKNGNPPTEARLEYNTNTDEAWRDYAIGQKVLLEQKGDWVQFRAKDTNGAFGTEDVETEDVEEENNYQFDIQRQVQASGNIMYLLDKTGTRQVVPAYAFGELFEDCKGLTSVPELPAKILEDDCYEWMFSGCTGLKSLPEKLLPATKLAERCYDGMFYGCTGLTSLPENLLPATTLAQECYWSMFQGCTGLTTLPEGLLPATKLAEHCYQAMFYECTALTSLPKKLLPAKTLADCCYVGMFSGCTGLTALPKNLLPATTLTESCYVGMFMDCTNLNAQAQAYIQKKGVY